MCITEDHLLSREGWSQLESVDETNWPSRMKLWFKRNSYQWEPINGQFEDVTATILREIEDSGSEMEQERRS